MLISHKAVIKLQHCHNHIIDGNLSVVCSVKKKKQSDCNETYMNNVTTEENSLNEELPDVSSENEHFELSEEIDNSVENELGKLLSDYDNVLKRVEEMFESNPHYFIPAIRACSSAMKTSLSSET